MANRENKIILASFKAISNILNTAYKKTIINSEKLFDDFYPKTNGYLEFQDFINSQLQNAFEYDQLKVYDSFHNIAYEDQIKTTVSKFKGLKYNFSQVDQKSLEAFKSSQNWFTSKYFTLTDQTILLNQFNELWLSGLPVDVAVENMKSLMQNSNKRALKYTKTTILTNNTRVRTTADLNNYSQNGVEKYVYRAVIDNVTTELCRSLNGNTYNVNKALDYQNKVSNDVNNIIKDAERKNKPDYQIYNEAIQYLQNNDALSTFEEKNKDGSDSKKPWKTQVILRTKDPEKQGEKIPKRYTKLENVPGNKIPRPPLNYNCRSRLDPIL